MLAVLEFGFVVAFGVETLLKLLLLMLLLLLLLVIVFVVASLTRALAAIRSRGSWKVTFLAFVEVVAESGVCGEGFEGDGGDMMFLVDDAV